MRRLIVNGDPDYEYIENETRFEDIVADLFTLEPNIKYHVDISMRFDVQESYEEIELGMTVTEYIDLVDGQMQSQKYGDIDGLLDISVIEKRKINEFYLF